MPCDGSGKESSVPASEGMYMAPVLTKVHGTAQDHGSMIRHARVSDEVNVEGDLTKSVASGNLSCTGAGWNVNNAGVSHRVHERKHAGKRT